VKAKDKYKTDPSKKHSGLKTPSSPEASSLTFAEQTIFPGLLELLPDVLVRFRSDGRIVLFHQTEATNLPDQGSTPEHLGDLFPLPTATQILEESHQALRTRKMRQFEIQHLHKGEFREYEIRLLALDNEEFLALIRDITTHKQYQFEVERSEKKFRILLESAAQAIIVVNIHGRITLSNTKAEELFGYDRDELIDQPIEILIPERIRAKHLRYRNEFLTRPVSRPMGAGMELMALHKDKSEFPVEVGLSSIEIYEGTFVMAFITDISERKELDKKLREVEKLEAIGQLAGGIAHDFNNVLAGIIGLSELALRKIHKGEQADQNLQLIIEKAGAAANLVKQLLTFSRKQIVSLRPINLNFVIQQNIKLLQRYLGEEIELKTSLQKNLFNVEADDSALDQIITNLSINARDAMPDGGEISIVTENIILNYSQYTETGEMPEGKYIKLAVIDHGIGMTREIRQHIFEPFFTTKDIGEGTGLGLSIVYGLVKQLNGFMNCRSRIGEGTTFEIFLPAVEAHRTPSAEPHHTVVKPGTETILLVENEADLLATYKNALESYGYKVLVAANGLRALNIYEQKSTSIDLIVSDVVMPKMGGVELKLVAQRINPEVKFLFISAYADKMEPGTPLLQKPFRAKDLAKKVREVLDQS